jgi:hypothetical protein
MPDEVPLVDDDVIKLLSLLANSADGTDGQGRGGKLTDILKHPDRPARLNTQALAKPEITRVANTLTRLIGGRVELLQPDGRLGTFATPECLALCQALQVIAQERHNTKEAARRQRRLEWLQLATCLDPDPLRIGAYQAHAERFLATAGQLMVRYFPWVRCTVSVEENRLRHESIAHGVVRQKFDNREYDFMLVPRDSERAHTDFVYEYSFRVVGTAEKLSQLRDSDGVIDRSKLRGETLIVAPDGSSSRQRVRELLLDADIDIEQGAVELVEERNPATMRLHAVSGQGLAIMSDEYTIVGASNMDFPYLGLGTDGEKHERKHKVQMGLLRHKDADKPRHQAFDFVIQELVALEGKRPRAAAQD